MSPFLSLLLCIPLQAHGETVAPKDIQKGSHWQLFLDDHVIERSTGFRRVLHHPKPRGIVIPADKPWETIGLSPVYVGRRTDGSLECYYRVHGPFKYETMGYASARTASTGPSRI